MSASGEITSILVPTQFDAGGVYLKEVTGRRYRIKIEGRGPFEFLVHATADGDLRLTHLRSGLFVASLLYLQVRYEGRGLRVPGERELAREAIRDVTRKHGKGRLIQAINEAAPINDGRIFRVQRDTIAAKRKHPLRGQDHSLERG